MTGRNPPKITLELTELEAKALNKLLTAYFVLRKGTNPVALGIRQHMLAALARVKEKLDSNL